MHLKIRPLTPDLWPALEDLFAPKEHATTAGACTGESEPLTATNPPIRTMLRSDSSGSQSRTVSYTLSSGQTLELECSQGKPAVSYQIVSQR
jgi:hypothetical protein